MAQLLVREIESAVVKKLRGRAAAQGISVEEAHRRLLRAALLGDDSGPQGDFIAYLRGIPQEEPIEFPRQRDVPRRVDL
ncbi:MAG: FitA-like ribbon-helix-helix domain-containing protein [Opitutaceae bacterium]